MGTRKERKYSSLVSVLVFVAVVAIVAKGHKHHRACPKCQPTHSTILHPFLMNPTRSPLWQKKCYISYSPWCFYKCNPLGQLVHVACLTLGWVADFMHIVPGSTVGWAGPKTFLPAMCTEIQAAGLPAAMRERVYCTFCWVRGFGPPGVLCHKDVKIKSMITC